MLFGFCNPDVPEPDAEDLATSVQSINECLALVNSTTKRATPVFVALDDPEDHEACVDV